MVVIVAEHPILRPWTAVIYVTDLKWTFFFDITLINSSFLMVCFFPRFNCWAIIGFSSFSWTVGNLLNSVYALQVAHTFGLHNQPSLRSPVFSWDHLTDPCDEKMPKGGWLDVTDPRRPPLWMTCISLAFFGWPSGSRLSRNQRYIVAGKTRFGERIFARPGNHICDILEAICKYNQIYT